MFPNDQTVFSFRGPFSFPIEIRQSILFLLGLYVVFTARSAQGLIDALITVGLLLSAIFLHEMGHAWGCRVQGITVNRVVIFGGGGFCQHRSSSYRQDELIVAMGPIVNLALWATSSMVVQWGIANTTQASSTATYEFLFWLYTFGFINLALFFFNMVPVQPLDGGKLFHLLMRRFFSPTRALRYTGAVGVVFSVLWWPGLFFLFMTTGWLLFYIPSVKLHLQMMRGERFG